MLLSGVLSAMCDSTSRNLQKMESKIHVVAKKKFEIHACKDVGKAKGGKVDLIKLCLWTLRAHVRIFRFDSCLHF